MKNAHGTARRITFLSVIAFASLSRPVLADDPAPVAPSNIAAATSASDFVLVPTVSFRADPAGSDLFDALKASPIFASLSKEAPGSPIELRIYHSVQPAHLDAKNFFSGLLSVGTLGLSPVVMTGAHTMHYEIFVNGEKIARYEYTETLSRNERISGAAADTTHGLGADGVIWAAGTVKRFLNDLSHDAAVRALNAEYQTYFGGQSKN